MFHAGVMWATMMPVVLRAKDVELEPQAGMSNMLRVALLSFVLVAGASSLEAQSTKGVFLGVQYSGSSVSVTSAAEDLDFGGGYGLHAGLGLSDTWSVLANFDRSVLPGAKNTNDVTLSQYDALLRMSLLPGASSPFRVFLAAGATARTANSGRDFEDISPTGGAGAQLSLTSKIAVNGTALWTFGKLTRASQLRNGQEGQFESTATRVQAGISLYLFGK